MNIQGTDSDPADQAGAANNNCAPTDGRHPTYSSHFRSNTSVAEYSEPGDERGVNERAAFEERTERPTDFRQGGSGGWGGAGD